MRGELDKLSPIIALFTKPSSIGLIEKKYELLFPIQNISFYELSPNNVFPGLPHFKMPLLVTKVN